MKYENKCSPRIMHAIYISAISQQVPVAVETVIQLETVVTEDPPSISFSWNEIQGEFGVYIYRKVQIPKHGRK